MFFPPKFSLCCRSPNCTSYSPSCHARTRPPSSSSSSRPAERALRRPRHLVEALQPLHLVPRRALRRRAAAAAQQRLRVLHLRHLGGRDGERRGGAVGELLVAGLGDGEEGVEAHPEDGDEDAGDVAEGEGVPEEDVAEGEDEARLEVPQHLVRHRRRRPDHQERAEVHAHRDRAGQHDERHDLEGVGEGEDVAVGEELVDERAGDEQHGGLVRRRLVQQLRRRHLQPPLDLVRQL
jgi:hypothetical protein